MSEWKNELSAQQWSKRVSRNQLYLHACMLPNSKDVVLFIC